MINGIRLLITTKSGVQYLGNVHLSYDASRGGRGLFKPSKCRLMGEGVWPNRRITFIVV